ncbi:MAG: metallophosphoesterase [Sulfolobaceae archaeon]|nr:metallophosphoesterase [Sulfolobales archaeon]
MSLSQSELRENAFAILEKAKDLMLDLYKRRPHIGPFESKRVAFVGDTHGAFEEVTKFVLGAVSKEVDLIVFLGDYVDREPPNGLENLLAILKVFADSKGEKVVFIRGNHESPLTNYYYGFYDEVTVKLGGGAYEKFKEFFSLMPISAEVNGWFAVHGGLPGLPNQEGKMELAIKRPSEINEKVSLPDENPDNPIALQLLWNDPREMREYDFLPNVRGDGIYYFGVKPTEEFLEGDNLKGIIRGHEVANGVRVLMEGKVINVFSSVYHGESAGVLILEGNEPKEVILINPNGDVLRLPYGQVQGY